MTSSKSVRTVSPASLAKLRDWLDLLAALGDFNQPINSPEGLRQAIAVLLRLGETVGLDPVWLARFGAVLEDPAVFDIVLAVEKYLLRLITAAPRPTPTTGTQPGENITIQSLSLNDWLSLIAEVLQLLGRLRATK
jgi:hypothetical protein